jgi:four helix bundle suffix protein
MSEKKPDGSDGSGGSDEGEKRKRIRPSGGYRKLRSFQTTTVIYDATVSFCDRFLDKRSRTVDQMVQAARSGRQNIAEGSRANATSSQTELRLVTVARASLDELLLDYEDYLRQRGLAQWGKDDPPALEVRAVGKRLADRADSSDRTDQSDGEAYARWLGSKDSAVVANALICLIHQANYLLDQQIASLERQFVEGGGYSEQLAVARIEKRKKDRTDPSDATDRSEKDKPACPLCKGLMVPRTAKKGSNAGSQFWGCAGYPKCKGTQKLDGSGGSVESDSGKE